MGKGGGGRSLAKPRASIYSQSNARPIQGPLASASSATASGTSAPATVCLSWSSVVRNGVGYFLFSGEQHGFRKASNIQRCLDAETRLLRDRSLPDRAHVLTHALIVAHPLHEKAVPDTNGIAPPMHKDLNLTEGAQRDDVVGLDQNRSRVHQGTGQSVEGQFSSEGSSKTAKYNGRGSASRQ